MVHRVSQQKLSRSTNARRHLLKNLATSLVLHEKIKTTSAKAKALRPYIEKLVTKAKKNTLVNRRYLSGRLDGNNSIKKMVELVGPTFKERLGGYTRIVKLPPRTGDKAEMALIEFVENVSEIAAKKKLQEKSPKDKISEKTKRGTKKPPIAKKEQSKNKKTKMDPKKR